MSDNTTPEMQPQLWQGFQDVDDRDEVEWLLSGLTEEQRELVEDAMAESRLEKLALIHHSSSCQIGMRLSEAIRAMREISIQNTNNTGLSAWGQ